MSDKSISDLIQSILDKNKGFMTISKLMASLSKDAKSQLGIKSGDTGKIIRRKLEQSLSDCFMFSAKGRIVYILTPCEPSELVLNLLSPKKALDTRTISSLPFTKAVFISIINDLVDEGKAKIKVDDKFIRPKFFSVEANKIQAVKIESSKNKSDDTGDYTREKFREAFDSLDKGRIFVRICDLRRKLGWPREVFDEMIRKLRNEVIIGIYIADESVMTQDELNDCFVDENNYRMGTVAWNVK